MTGALHTTCRAALVAVALAVAMLPAYLRRGASTQGVIDSEPPPDAGPRTTTPDHRADCAEPRGRCDGACRAC
jgi:hypothetical protein